MTSTAHDWTLPVTARQPFNTKTKFVESNAKEVSVKCVFTKRRERESRACLQGLRRSHRFPGLRGIAWPIIAKNARRYRGCAGTAPVGRTHNRQAASPPIAFYFT
jgi:hypothetical protein